VSSSANSTGAINSLRLPARLPVEASSARTVTLHGREYLFFGGCGYLALGHEPRVLAALSAGAARYGTSSGAARETTGNVVEHEALEREIAAALGLEDALITPEGAGANLALCEALATEPIRCWVDADAHPTLRSAARFADPALREFQHDDLAALRAQSVLSPDPIAIFSDGVFPSAGRAANIAELLECLPRGRGHLVIDDCHGLGVLGARGRGSLEAAGVRDERIVITGTLSKALGTYGGFVAGARACTERVREHSHTYAGTTPLVPPLACAARAALAILVDEPQRHADYMQSLARFRARLGQVGVPLKHLLFPVCAFELEPGRMQRLHEFAKARGVFLPLIHYAGGGAHGFFRIVWNAAHTTADLEQLAGVLGEGLQSA
jgi:8-amino-7-oxononanoate synthase